MSIQSNENLCQVTNHRCLKVERIFNQNSLRNLPHSAKVIPTMYSSSTQDQFIITGLNISPCPETGQKENPPQQPSIVMDAPIPKNCIA